MNATELKLVEIEKALALAEKARVDDMVLVRSEIAGVRREQRYMVLGAVALSNFVPNAHVWVPQLLQLLTGRGA